MTGDTAFGRDSAIVPLLERGLLIAAAGSERLRPVCAPPMPRISVLEGAHLPTPRWVSVASAAGAVAAARTSLRWRGLERTVRSLAMRRRTAETQPARHELEEFAAAFQRLDFLLSPLGACLPRSIALTALLARRKLAARLVIGVKLRPFLAHAWVASDGLLLNERADVVRAFTPILVI
ncbi:MAG TPA: lasso peptide biosynthesis B2 protein [Allosphingosinicella sp.]|nr:lasso peptide biosynthesis B2 protein [Allosphingosinicella sp.]